MYKLKNSGGVIDLSTGASVPDAPGNSDWERYLAWVADGNEPEAADPVPAPTYRQRRRRAYIGLNTIPGLGVEAQLLETVGDVLDIIIKEVSAQNGGAGVTQEFNDMLAKIDAIKTRYPKD